MSDAYDRPRADPVKQDPCMSDAAFERTLDPRRLRLAAATRDLVAACGGVERAGRLVGKGASSISRWQSAHHAESIPVLDALTLEMECGLPLVTSALAGLQHLTLDASPDAPGQQPVADRQARVLVAAADLMREGAEALCDGRITPAEAETMDRAAGELDRSLEELRCTLAAHKSGRKG